MFAPTSPKTLPLKTRGDLASPPGESAGGSGYKVVLVLTAFVIMRRFLAHVFLKSIKGRGFVVAGLISLGWIAPSIALEQRTLSPAQFTALVGGRVLMGEYPDGRAWREKFLDRENSIYSEGGQHMPGKVSAKNRYVCFSYNLQSGLVGGCFEIWQRSANCFDFYGTGGDDKRTVASEQQKRLSLAWGARGRLADRPSTCVSAQTS